MKTSIYLTNVSILILICITFSSCKKFLDKKPEQTLAIASTLADLNALMDNEFRINIATGISLTEIQSDNYYLLPAIWQRIDPSGIYIWDKSAVPASNWEVSYTGPIYYSNVVLDILPTIKNRDTDRELGNYIEGAALFHRAFAFFQLAEAYCKPYSSSAKMDMGVVLRLSASIEDKSIRSNLQATYDQILNDLKKSAELLPVITKSSWRPNKSAVYGALARVFISMRDYGNAKLYADLALQLNSKLLDYNGLDVSSPTPFLNVENPEVIFMHTGFNTSFLTQSRAIVDSTLYESYHVNDLRKQVYFMSFAGQQRFKGSYFFAYPPAIFDGIATDELYLIRAECYARDGNKDAALKDLNTLMINRWDKVNWSPIVAADANAVLNLILIERRKELIWRGLRWGDLRRLNLEGANITLKRILNGNLYSLPPSDLRWVALIPQEEMLRSGITQNPR